MGQLSNGGCERDEIWHKSALGDENDARTSNTCIAERKREIPHSMMKNHRKIISVVKALTRGNL